MPSEHFGSECFSSQAAFSRILAERPGSMRYRAVDPVEHAGWRDGLRRTLWRLTGMDVIERPPLQARARDRVEGDCYRRDEIVLQTEPGIWMPVSVLVPNGLPSGERAPCVVAAHGHGSDGRRAVAGWGDTPSVREAIARYHYDYGAQLARLGFIVFCPEARGMGERREPPDVLAANDPPTGCTCRALSQMASGIGRTVTGLWTWDLIRLIDYIETRPDCDPSRLAGVGFSSGGQQILWLAALDDRVTRIAVSGYFYGYRESLLLMPFNCACNYVPHLWEYVDMGDLAALIAPRPLLVETGTRDPLNGSRGAENAREQAGIAVRAYETLGASGRFRHIVFDGGHEWYGQEVLDLLGGLPHVAENRED